jgi:hypothetical protein
MHGPALYSFVRKLKASLLVDADSTLLQKRFDVSFLSGDGDHNHPRLVLYFAIKDVVASFDERHTNPFLAIMKRVQCASRGSSAAGRREVHRPIIARF